jgi:hypothetical protein
VRINLTKLCCLKEVTSSTLLSLYTSSESIIGTKQSLVRGLLKAKSPSCVSCLRSRTVVYCPLRDPWSYLHRQSTTRALVSSPQNSDPDSADRGEQTEIVRPLNCNAVNNIVALTGIMGWKCKDHFHVRPTRSDGVLPSVPGRGVALTLRAIRRLN